MSRFSLLITLVFAANAVSYAQATFYATDLKCEHLTNPLGIDTSHPRLSWRMQDNRPAAAQTAYRLTVHTDSAALVGAHGSAWDTGWVPGSSTLVTYAGEPIKPFTRYFWRVDIKDHLGNTSAASTVASFETGLMDRRNWQGAWIADGTDTGLKPAPYFRRELTLGKKIKTARAYIAVAGLYELYINGRKIGNDRLNPAYTRFDRRTLYTTYDITPALQTGRNAVGVLLGNGWYNHQSTAVWFFDKAPWRNRPAFCMDLRITYDDGTVETFSSGKDWKTSLSPVVFNSIYTAEHYDARLEQPGWNTVGFDAAKWRDVVYRQAPSNNIVAQVMHPIRNVETIPARSIKKLNDSTYLFDLGRNIAGVSSIVAKGAPGTRLRLKHGERLRKDGHVDMSNIDAHYRPVGNADPFQTDIVVLAGKGEETFMPRFNYKGFQYVEVTSSAPVALELQSLTGYFMHSDVPPAGQVQSSNPVLDKIWSATNNSYLSNLAGYPTDCPQREKNGWTGDAQIAIETGLYSFDGITVYEKWMADHRDEQQPNGVLPSIVPTGGWGYEWGNGPDWTSTIAIIPWQLYLFYGDSRALADCYDNIRRYVDYIDGISPTGLTTWGLGDWVPVKSRASVELTSTCYYFADATILSRAARLLGKPDDAAKYAALADKIKRAFNAKYFDAGTGLYGSGIQTELSVPLFWGLVPQEHKATVARNLARRVEADQFHLDVGLLGQKAILNALSDNGYGDVAYKVAAQETFPSWGWWIKNGATTLYENWNIAAEHDISLNHIMFGEIGAWMYKGLGGILPDPAQPGFAHIILKPALLPALQQFAAQHEGPQGTIRSSWKKAGKGVVYTAVIPANSTATLHLPEMKGLKAYQNGKVVTGTVLELAAGIHQVTWK